VKQSADSADNLFRGKKRLKNIRLVEYLELDAVMKALYAVYRILPEYGYAETILRGREIL